MERNLCDSTKKCESQLMMFLCAVLPGPDVLSSHCTFRNSSGEVFLCPASGAFVTVNSHLIEDLVKLSQGMHFTSYV